MMNKMRNELAERYQEHLRSKTEKILVDIAFRSGWDACAEEFRKMADALAQSSNVSHDVNIARQIRQVTEQD